jgi:hypothetical protein
MQWRSLTSGVVALTDGDLPKGRFAGLRRIQPAFDPRPQRWRYIASKRLFFVGNIAHYGGRMDSHAIYPGFGYL